MELTLEPNLGLRFVETKAVSEMRMACELRVDFWSPDCPWVYSASFVTGRAVQPFERTDAESLAQIVKSTTASHYADADRPAHAAPPRGPFKVRFRGGVSGDTGTSGDESAITAALIPTTFEFPAPTTDVALCARLYVFQPESVEEPQKMQVKTHGHAQIRFGESRVSMIMNEDYQCYGKLFPYATLHVKWTDSMPPSAVDLSYERHAAMRAVYEYNVANVAWIKRMYDNGHMIERVARFSGSPLRYTFQGVVVEGVELKHLAGMLGQTEVRVGWVGDAVTHSSALGGGVAAHPPATEEFLLERLEQSGWEPGKPKLLLRAVNSHCFSRRYVSDANYDAPNYDLLVDDLTIPGDCADAAFANYRLWVQLLTGTFKMGMLKLAQVEARKFGVPAVVLCSARAREEAASERANPQPPTDPEYVGGHRVVVLIPWQKLSRALYGRNFEVSMSALPLTGPLSETVEILDGVTPCMVKPVGDLDESLKTLEALGEDSLSSPNLRIEIPLSAPGAGGINVHDAAVRALWDPALFLSETHRRRYSSSVLTASGSSFRVIDLTDDPDPYLERTKNFVLVNEARRPGFEVGSIGTSCFLEDFRMVRSPGIDEPLFRANETLCRYLRPIVPVVPYLPRACPLSDELVKAFGQVRGETERAVFFVYRDAKLDAGRVIREIKALKTRLGCSLVYVGPMASSTMIILY